MRYFERWAMAHDINKLPENEREATAKEAIARWYSQPDLVTALRQISAIPSRRHAINATAIVEEMRAVAAAALAKVYPPSAWRAGDSEATAELVTKLEILGEWARQVSDRKDVPQAIREAGLGCYRQAVAAVKRAKEAAGPPFDPAQGLREPAEGGAP